MRKKVEYYHGYEITKEVLKEINRIESKRIAEGITQFNNVKVETLEELCEINETTQEQEHIILGEDWYINYANISEEEIDIKNWVAIDKVENKFTQTIEMFNALKKILLEYQHCDIYSMLRHSTSYPFYKKLMGEGYIDEGYDIIDFDDSTPKLEEIKEQILTEYDSFEDYLSDESREKYEDSNIEDYIYHNVVFNTTEKFRDRYKK